MEEKRKVRKARLEADVKIARAINHPTRFAIVDELSKGEKCIEDLTHMIEEDTPSMSKHLLMLKNRDIVKVKKRNYQIYYSLKNRRIEHFIQYIKFRMKSYAKEIYTQNFIL